MNYQDINIQTIEGWIADGWEWGKPVDHETCVKAKNGDWDVVLTPTKPVPHEWFGDIKGKKILGLASGGGQRMPILTAAGAVCTVLDYSQKQLDSDLMVARREGLSIEAIRGDMTKPLPFADGTFDLIFHPVSNVYVEKIEPIWRECFRVLKNGGILLAGIDNGFNFIFDEEEQHILFTLPFNPLKNPDQMKWSQETDSGVQFSHTIEEQLGGQLKAGFILTDIFGDTNGCGNLHEHGVESFYATRSIKP